jgi:hypothetical protein
MEKDYRRYSANHTDCVFIFNVSLCVKFRLEKLDTPKEYSEVKTRSRTDKTMAKVKGLLCYDKRM